MARPKKEKAKIKQFRLRMTEEDFYLLEAFAEKAGKSKTEVMTVALNNLVFRLPDKIVREILLKVAIRINAKDPADILICDEMDEETYNSLPKEGVIMVNRKG